MATFRIGQRVQLVRTDSRKKLGRKWKVGLEGEVVGDWTDSVQTHYNVRWDGIMKYVAVAESQLAPINPQQQELL